MQRGLFISIEGADGSGKSTQVRLLGDYLRARGIDVVVTREPGGGGEGAMALRNLLLTGPAERWSPMTEALLMYAARAEHLEKLIRPALAAGKMVLTDRFADSTLAYQGYAGGLGPARIKLLHEATVGSDDPDLTIILDLPADVGLQRAASRRSGESRFEDKGAEYQAAVRNGFLAIAASNSRRCRVIDAAAGVDEVQRAIAKVVDSALQSHT